MQRSRVARHWVAALGLTVALASDRASAKEGERCSGPEQCCPAELSEKMSQKVTVSLGAVLVGLNNVAERSGTWDADVYLYETWPATPGFSPQTDVVNEVARVSEDDAFDLTTFDGTTCSRSRRLRLTLHTSYNLRRFPFDHQRLELELSDSEFDSSQVVYAAAPSIAGIDDRARDQLSAWKIEDDLSYERDIRAFRWEPGSPNYDYATFFVHARRHVSFHIARYFLPLFVLVASAFGVFWIDPEDLNTQVTIGVTCLLAVIAQQIVELSNLPEVAYLTFADRIYVISYVVIAASVFESLHTNALVRAGKRDLAVRIDYALRLFFPLFVVLAVAAAVVVSFSLATF